MPQRNNIMTWLGKLIAALMFVLWLDWMLIEWLLYPDCNRMARDCFLVQYVWR